MASSSISSPRPGASSATPQRAVEPPCDHPKAARRPAVLRDDAQYCRRCSSLVMEDGTTEPVNISSVRGAYPWGPIPDRSR